MKIKEKETKKEKKNNYILFKYSSQAFTFHCIFKNVENNNKYIDLSPIDIGAY